MADGAESSLRSLAALPGAGAVGLLHQIGVPWEVIALMVLRLQPHARKVRKILEEADGEKELSDDP